MMTVQHTESIIGMDPLIYKAAEQGNLRALEKKYDTSHLLDEFLTVNENTILHICISSILVKEKFPTTGGTDLASAVKFVEDVLSKCPSLLFKANAEDDTPLHLAARYGHASIVKVLIDCKKAQHQDLENVVATKEMITREMIGMLNKKGDTTLHDAVRHNHIEVVKQLLREVDREFSFGANGAGETPLYLAAERHFPDLVSEILNTFQSPAYDGPLGRTALHAATFSNDAGMTENILERYGRDLCKQTDQRGWTPLYLAAYLGCIEPTKLLLQYGREVAYMKDAEGRTALHIAAHRNQEGVTKEIISMCPDCCEVVDNEGRNALHLAVHSRWPTAALIIQNNLSLRNLLNQEDNHGNTALHHYYNSVGYTKGVMNSPRVDEMVFNKKNQTAFQILRSKRFPTDGDEVQYSALQRKRDEFYKGQKNHWFLFNGRVLKTGYDEIEKEKQPEGDEDWQEMEKKKEEMDKAAQAHLVVAALITTVTFAAGITMPGGFIGGDDHPHPGSAVLEKSIAFKAFIITNALALMLSSSAVFIYLFIPFIPSKSFFRQRLCFAQMAFWFLISSMAPMVLAFVTGTYAVLEHSNIAIPTCIICLSFITILVFIFLKIRLYL